MFLGIVFIASFGAAGVLSAIAAADPAEDNGYEIRATSYLIGTSVSYQKTLFCQNINIL